MIAAMDAFFDFDKTKVMAAEAKCLNAKAEWHFVEAVAVIA